MKDEIISRGNKMTYAEYLKIKTYVVEEDATVNFVAEKLGVPIIIARCLVKDWKSEHDE